MQTLAAGTDSDEVILNMHTLKGHLQLPLATECCSTTRVWRDSKAPPHLLCYPIHAEVLEAYLNGKLLVEEKHKRLLIE